MPTRIQGDEGRRQWIQDANKMMHIKEYVNRMKKVLDNYEDGAMMI